MKIFGREPTLWIAVLTSAVSIIGTLGLHIINGPQAALAVVAINGIFGAINAFAVRPISPVAFTYAIGALVALGAGYGLNVPDTTVATINAAVIPLLALITRNQVEPQQTAISRA